MRKIILDVLKVIPEIFKVSIFNLNHFRNRKTNSRTYTYKYLRKNISSLNNKIGVDLHITGLDNIPNEQSFVIFPNHQGMVDATIMFSIFEEPIAFIAKDSLEKVPVIGKAIAQVGGLFIERDNLRQELKAMKIVKESLINDNVKWIIFPEGTRTKDVNSCKMNDFKPGTFKYPMSINKKIIPCAIYGTQRLLDDKYHWKKHPVYVHFFEPLDESFYKGKTTAEVSQYTHDLIQKKVDEFIELDKTIVKK